MPKTSREVALEVIHRVHKTGSYANLLLPKKLQESGLDRRDRAFVTELTYGTLRAKGTLDWIIKRYSKQRLEKIPDLVLDLIRMSSYQIIYMDVPDRAAVNEAIVLAKKYFHPGISKFVNGLLRTIAREKEKLPWPNREKDPLKYISLKYFHPLWMVKMWVEEFGIEETEALCEANNRIPRLTIRVNTLKVTPEKLSEVLRQAGWEVEPGRYLKEALSIRGVGDISKLPQFKEGYFYVQDESSMVISHVVDPQPGETVLDAAAAPGGKTTHMAELMQNKGQIISVDINPNRVNLMKQNIERMGATIALALKADVTKLRPVVKKPVDRILLDAPCSGLGVLSRRPDARWAKKPEQIDGLSHLQTDMLVSAADLVKPGGVLVYSVCTLTKQETRLVVERLLRVREDFYVEDVSPYLPEALRADVKDGVIQLLPYKHGIDGLFIARLRREE
ncbi:MAG: 16S rRNA (cytosine(967)-C(5))-methyltransferase RsmB [Actinobacteria bacterium]|nr:16S rRNA (cytosine(967)-C(5))-methyltransferase RsmB [Actinomycetota bacterium]